MVIKYAKDRITQGYSNEHRGVDLGYRSDEKLNIVYSNCSGVVEEIQVGIPNDKGASGVRSWGNYVLIKHPNGMYSRYAHLKEVYCKRGEYVNENTSIGLIGDSGNAYGRHLHFEVQTGYSSNTRIDPTQYLDKRIYEEPKKEEPKQDTTKFKVGDRVCVSGYATASSNGSGNRTATYGGNKNDSSDIRYVTKIATGAKRPYHISVGNSLGNGDRGWVSECQLTKV